MGIETWYECLAGLPLKVEGHRLEILTQPVSSGFDRVVTLVTVFGAGAEGAGEDVTYEAPAHEAELPARSAFDLRSDGTLGSFSDRLEQLLPVDAVPYSRWGYESAALDLALRQAGVSLPGALGITFQPLRFVVSTRLGSPPSAHILEGWVQAQPSLEFKLDPQSSWTPELAAGLAATGRVRVVDLKGAYSGTPVDQPYDPALYRLVRDTFVEAYIEDPAPTAEALTLLVPARHRLSWDAVIHSADDVRGLTFRPGAINIKPSRFGTLRRLFETIAYCRAEGIPLYGGGQFELGPGRDQIQAIASLCYPAGPNDVAPREYNYGDPRPGLPASPLPPPSAPRPGFGFSPATD